MFGITIISHFLRFVNRFSEIYQITFWEIEKSLPCVKGGGTACRDGGIVKKRKLQHDNPSVNCRKRHLTAPFTQGSLFSQPILRSFFRDAEVLVATRSRSRFDSPPDCHSFRSRRFATSSPTRNFNIHRRGDSRIARFFTHGMRSFSAGDEPPPYKRNLTSSKVLAHNTVLFLKNQFCFAAKIAHSA